MVILGILELIIKKGKVAVQVLLGAERNIGIGRYRYACSYGICRKYRHGVKWPRTIFFYFFMKWVFFHTEHEFQYIYNIEFIVVWETVFCYKFAVGLLEGVYATSGAGPMSRHTEYQQNEYCAKEDPSAQSSDVLPAISQLLSIEPSNTIKI